MLCLPPPKVNSRDFWMRSGRSAGFTDYSIHTERSYVDWTVQIVRFHHMHSRGGYVSP